MAAANESGHAPDAKTRVKNIGIMVSGGLDSAVLLFLLLKQIGPALKVFTVPRSDDSVSHAKRVTKAAYFHLKLECPGPILVGDPTLHHSLQVWSGVQQALNGHLADVIFIADNKLPDDPELIASPFGPIRKSVESRWVKQPFLKFSKDQILAAAFDAGLEFLLAETHTCSERTIGHCGQCWPCQERAWAFAKIGRSDPGIG